ncbi:hypothetical protein ElyMa_002663500 [Elysia marginata]|uniref:Uncharacterized protein n=1 Tax=Elysia marginata TaxID=1093978 RepID=A0AAV4H9W7_9GAST|nr:hypothetical protein ElyMa_002663500 [Elysia marginata]
MNQNNGDTLTARDRDTRAVSDSMDTTRSSESGNNNVGQFEMDQLNDPTRAEIVQANLNGGTKDGASAVYPTKSKLEESREEQEPSLAPEDKERDDDEVSDFDVLDLDDRDKKEDAWKEANYFSRVILLFQNLVFKILHLLKRLTSGYLWTAVFIVGFAIYFIFAMVHK